VKDQIREISNAIDAIQDQVEDLVSFEGLVSLTKDILNELYPPDTLPLDFAEGGSEAREFMVALRHFLEHADPVVALQHELQRARTDIAATQERAARLDMVQERARRLSDAIVRKAGPETIEAYRAELMKSLEKGRG